MSIQKLTKEEVAELIKKAAEDMGVPTAIWNSNVHGNHRSPNYWSNLSNMYYKNYQEPERDEQGTLYGYKVLIINLENGEFLSPVYPTPWSKEGTLEADREPDESNQHGIYCVKRSDDRKLVELVDCITSKLRLEGQHRRVVTISVLVKLAVSGTVIEGETGFRGRHARIIGVLIDGHWQSYQEAYESARRYYIARQAHRNETYWENEDYERYIKGNWNSSP